jgi:N-methylhydantoinase A
VTLRLRARLRPSRNEPGLKKSTVSRRPSSVEHGPVLFSGEAIQSAIYSREGLRVGKKYRGPAVVTEYSATTVVPPGMQFWMDSAENLIIAVRWEGSPVARVVSLA